ncbi:hypothetical protein HELRODRAFT_184840 [Helobdella robusta]|uniref:Beclin 1-associated autophagy-related key regulator n=1 Tax=Helobdella robusta TaxID=6412 RepID=T1FM26_HELRO|nr:hypothetical protein HELRODRAFT_184840 [Helobdella robusta]ESO12738.1 hypothetical protein HELRODRAFT_184840 [Helobdella robusta]
MEFKFIHKDYSSIELICSADCRKSEISVAVEICQLCDCTKRPFYCQKCVNNGTFTRSSHQNNLSQAIKNLDYREAKKLWETLKSDNNELKKKIESLLAKQIEEKRKKLAITSARQKLTFLKTALTCLKTQYNKDRSNFSKLRSDREKTQKDITLVRAKFANIQKVKRELVDKHDMYADKFKRARKGLIEIRRLYVKQLVECLFPITTYKPTSDSTDSLNGSNTLISLLKDAQFTAYVGGRWVYADSGWDQMYKVIEASLPGNGDYVAYMHSGGANDPLLQIHEEPKTAAQWSVCAGLSFLSQLVFFCAYFLGYKLPYSMHFKVFSAENLKEEQLVRYANRLNKNILHFCLYEHVDRSKLQGMHTVINILHLIRSPHLGCDALFNDPYGDDSMERVGEDAGGSKNNNDLHKNPCHDSIFACFNDCDDDDDDDYVDDFKAAPGRGSVIKVVDKDWEFVSATLPHSDIFCQQERSSSFISSIFKAFGVSSPN